MEEGTGNLDEQVKGTYTLNIISSLHAYDYSFISFLCTFKIIKK